MANRLKNCACCVKQKVKNIFLKCYDIIFKCKKGHKKPCRSSCKKCTVFSHKFAGHRSTKRYHRYKMKVAACSGQLKSFNKHRVELSKLYKKEIA